MALTALDKININKYLREHAMGDIYFGNMREALGRRRDKVADFEFLDYFTEYVVSELRKDEKFSVNHLIKVVSCVYAILGWMHDEKQQISDETLDKIRSFKEFYDDYLQRTGMEKDNVLSDNYIVATIDKVNELYPSDVANESVSKYITKIADLEKKIKKLEMLLDDERRTSTTLTEDQTKKAEKIDSLINNIHALERDVRSKFKEITRLNETIAELNTKVGELSDGTLSQVQEKSADLTQFEEQYEFFSIEVKRLEGIIEADTAAKTAEDKLRTKHTNMEALMYQKMLFDRVNVDNLVRYIEANGLSTNSSEVSGLIRGMKKFITIDGSSFSTQPTYQIIPPVVKEDGTFSINVPFGCKHYDLMLVSDFHIIKIDSKIKKGYDILTNYCVKNNINLVLNLGDFYNGFSSYPLLDYENAIKNYHIVEETMSALPQIDGVYHAVLGGNHEKNMLRYGFDPIAMMAAGRDDFIDLGYTHSTISINSPTSYLGCFDIHHPDNFILPVDLDDDGIDIKEMSSYLQEIYDRQGRNRDDSYIDVFGHTHRNQFNYPGGYCYIPSYYGAGSKKGACHLRIYFDEDTDIKYMVFMPLSYSTGTKLDKTNEIVYQKVLRK